MNLSLSLKSSFFCAAGLAFFSLIMSSCGTTRPYVYMQGQFDTVALSKVKVTDPVMQKGDIISVVVYSDNPDATKIYNQSLIATPTSSSSIGGTEVTQVAGGSPTAPGYLIDERGNIEFQGLGLLHVEGLTRDGLKDLLDSKLKDSLLINPYYNIRFLNNRFTILGEVMRPGIFNIPSDHINLLEALGLAGDMTFYGRRDNILVIREQNGKREYGRMDITKPEVMLSPYFYLQQNDVVLVEQNKKKSIVNDQVTTRNLSILTSIIYTIVLVYSLVRK